jgi:hypothetical protein
MNHQAELQWEGGEAERLLHLDMDNNHKTMKMKPKMKMIYNTRPEFQDYPLAVFKFHFEKEVRKRKFQGEQASTLPAVGLPPLLPPNGTDND